MIKYQWIDNNADLAYFCQQAMRYSIIALDTEFVRIRSYYPKLGLIQLFDGENVYLIDPITISNFQPFVALLSNPKILKVLHACGEDLDIFQHYFNQLPEPMLDTQVMSAFLGLGTSIGFSKLVENYCQINLDKSASRTDWLKRPLTEKQCQYAAADVFYLLPIYQALDKLLSHTDWKEAVKIECKGLQDKRVKPLNIDKAYKKIANAWQLNSMELAILRTLEKWRIEEAQKRDLALNFVVKEAALWQIAKIQPKHTACLLEFMHPNEVRRYGKKLLLLVEQAKQLKAEEQPETIVRLIDFPHYKRDMAFLRKTINDVVPNQLPLEVFATKRQLEQLFKFQQQGQEQTHLPELLQGWRQPFGQKLWEIYQEFLNKNLNA